jgi:predicted lipoprotein
MPGRRHAAWRGMSLAAALMPLGGCKIEKTVVANAGQSSTSVFINDSSFSPDAMVASDWDAKVVPGLREKAGPYDDVAAAIAANADAAGQRFGFRDSQTGSPWVYAATVTGTVTAANTESRAGTVDVRTDGGRTVQLQIGPVVRGTAIRDSVLFRPFGSFKNQIDYAQFGKALNAQANATALSKLPRDKLVGAKIEALGVFPAAAGDAPPLITPVSITAEPKA